MKPFKIIYYILLVFVVAVTLLLIISSFPISGNFKALAVLSGSMEPNIKTGSVVIIKPEKDYKIGDVITFGPYSKITAPITHRIYDMKVAASQPVYITKGDANNASDIKEVQKKDVLGRVLFSVPYLGYAVDFAKKPIGFALIIIVPALMIIFDEVKKIYVEIKKNKNKETAV